MFSTLYLAIMIILGTIYVCINSFIWDNNNSKDKKETMAFINLWIGSIFLTMLGIYFGEINKIIGG